MAGTKIKGINIKIGADHMALSTALKDIEGKARTTSTELREIDRTIKTAGDSATVWKQKQDVLTTALEQSRAKLKLLEDAESDVREQAKKGLINSEQVRAFERETEKARSEVKKYESQIESASEKIKELGDESNKTADDVNEFADSTKDAGEQAKISASGGITAMTVALGTLIADGIRKAAGELKDFTEEVVKTGAEFESKMSNVKAISGATAEEFEKLNAKAQKMGATTKFTAAETADAFSYMAMAGWKANDMIAGIDGVLSLAAASGEDLATTSDIVTDAMTAFGLSADKANHFADVLAVASSNANTNVGMMGETFKYVAPIAGSLGYTVEDIAENIGLMANSGIKASQAGTALRSIITRLSTDAGASSKSLGALGILTEKLGVEFYNADGSARDFGDVLAETREKWKDLTDEQQTEYGSKIAGQEAISGFLAIMNSAPADIDKLKNSIENCDGAAQNMAGTMIDNLSGDMTIFESAVDGMKISLAKEFTPVLRDLVQYATEKVPDVEKVLEKVFEIAEKLIKESADDLPKLIEKSKELLPVVAGIGGAFAGWKATEKVGKGIETAKKLNDVLKLTSGFAGASALGIAGIASALIGGVGSYVYAVEKAKQAHLDEVYKDAKSESDELTNSIKDNIQALEDSKKAAQESIDTDKLHTDKIKNLRDELSGLVDANGKVKAGYEDRVKFITDELSRATGIEIEYIDGQIKKYDELKSKIDEVIEKKRAESLQNAYSSVYESAMLFNQGAGKNAADLMSNVTENKDIISNLQAKARRKVEDSYKSWADFGAFTSSNLENGWGQYLSYDDIEKLKAAEDSISQGEQALEELRKQFQQNTSDIEAYENAVQAMYENNYTKAQRYFARIGDLNYAAFKSSEGLIDEQKKNFSDAVNAALKVYEGSLAIGDNNAKKTFADTVKDITKQATDGGLSAGDMLSTGIVSKLSAIDGFDYQALLDFCNSAGVTLGDALGSTTAQTAAAYLAEIQDTIDNFKNSDSAASRMIGNSLQFAYSRLPFFADGGFLSSGQGIVAEAGPELLEVMNGGVKITPLTSSAHNTPVSSAGTTIINNEIHANIASSYDVWKLAEDLSRAENIIERSLGK